VLVQWHVYPNKHGRAHRTSAVPSSLTPRADRGSLQFWLPSS